jgi:NNP family nitrate/nitrite transporter-like MFS transporter
MNIFRLLLFWMLWYFAFSIRTVISPLLPLIQSNLSLSQATAGGLYLFMAGGNTFSVLLAGHIALKIGYKRLLLISFLSLSLLLAAFSYTNSYIAISAILFFLGFASGLYLPCAIPMLTASFERKHWGKTIGFHETAAGFSLLSVPFFVALLLGLVEWRTIFLLMAAATIGVTTAFWKMTPNPPPERKKSIPIGTLLRRTDFWVILILWVCCAMLSIGIYNIIPLFLVNEKGLLLEQANMAFSLSRIGGFSGQIAIGFFLDRYSTRKILFILMVASGVFTLAVAITETYWIIIAMLLLQGTFCVVFYPVGIVAISKVTKPEERAIFTGTIMAISGMLGIGLTPFMMGAIADQWSFQVGFVILGLLALAVCPLVRLLRDL